MSRADYVRAPPSSELSDRTVMSHINTELFISRRISSRKGGRENIMVRIATLTVAVGMAVMILALAVVTGFKREVTAKLVGFGSHVRIVSLHSNSLARNRPRDGGYCAHGIRRPSAALRLRGPLCREGGDDKDAGKRYRAWR